MKKTLATTTDFLDDVLFANRWLDKENLNDMMAYCASIGSKRHQWVIGLALREMYGKKTPCGFDPLECACEAAHRHGMRFDVIFKPFEGGRYSSALPLSFPQPDDVPVLAGRYGIIHNATPFVVRHPEMQHARHPDALSDPGGAIKQVMFVKNGPEPVDIKTEDFTLWYSDTFSGDGVERYDGPVSLSDTVEYRAIAPYSDQSCRVLTLGELELPEEVKVLAIHCDANIEPNSFQNRDDSLVELVNADGQIIPSEISPPPFKEKLIERLKLWARLGNVNRYIDHPDVKRIIDNDEEFMARIRKMNLLRCNREASQPLGKGIGNGSQIAVFRGKESFHPGVLNPVYPEVREHWLDNIQFFINRGVDGVNVRIGNHSQPFEPREFGFNPPTMAQMEYDDNLAEARLINGRAYTQFLQSAAELLHSAGKELGVHVRERFFYLPESRTGPRFQVSPLPGNIAWEWEKWIRDIVDYVEFRGAWTLNPVSLKDVIDRIGLAARESGKPLIYQSSRSNGVVSFDGPHAHLACELDKVKRHPDISEYNLYETANFTRINDSGRLEGSHDIAELVAGKLGGR